MDKALDDIISDRYRSGNGYNNRNNYNNRKNNNYRNNRNNNNKWGNNGGISKEGHNRDRGNRNYRSSNQHARRPHLTHMVKISNLHYELSEDDIHELLSRIGPVRQVRLQYDSTGRSNGIAYANFTNADDALEAVKQYNGKRAAGLEIAVQALDQSSSLRRRINVNNRNDDEDDEDSNENDSNQNNRQGRRTDRNTRPKKTMEELDAELNEYMSGRADQQHDQEPAEDNQKDDVVDIKMDQTMLYNSLT